MVITFCFYHFLTGRLGAEILTAKVWRKSLKSWWTPIFCWLQYFVTFWHAGSTPVNTYLLSTSSAMVLGLKLLSAQWNLRGCRWNSVEYSTKKNYKVLPQNILIKSFVDANILLMPIFCWHQYFVDAYLLMTPIFCQCLSFVYTKYFVDA